MDAHNYIFIDSLFMVTVQMSVRWTCVCVMSVFTNTTLSQMLPADHGRAMDIGITLRTGHSHLINIWWLLWIFSGVRTVDHQLSTMSSHRTSWAAPVWEVKTKINQSANHHDHQASVHILNHQALYLTWVHCMDVKRPFIILNQESKAKCRLCASVFPWSLTGYIKGTPKGRAHAQ